jgi:hypothetical protein
MNAPLSIPHFAHRLYQHGHRPSDFQLRLAPHLCIVEPIRPPGQTKGGIAVPGQVSTDLPGQFALAHRVVALPDHGPEGVMLWNKQPLRVGDVIKAREAHLDPVERNGNLRSLPLEHIVAVIATVTEVDSEGAAVAE